MTSARVIPNLNAGAGHPVSAVTKNSAGQPTRRFLKELTRAGRYENDGQQITIDIDMLDSFGASFERMKAAGVKVPLPSGHTLDADKNRGWVEEMYREGDSLMGVVEFVGDDAIAMAGRVDVSIYAEPDFVDGKGNRYDWAVTHVALTPVPVVNNLGNFVEIAASKGDKPVRAPVFRLCRSDSPKGSNMDWKKIAAAFGHQGEITDANAETVLLGFADKLKDARAIAASRKPGEEITPTVLRLSAKNRKGDIQRLRDTGRISNPVALELETIFVGKDNAAIRLDMSEGGRGDDVFDAVVAALSKNNPVELGERIRSGKIAAMARETPDNEPPAYDPKVTDEMVAMAYPGAKK